MIKNKKMRLVSFEELELSRFNPLTPKSDLGLGLGFRVRVRVRV